MKRMTLIMTQCLAIAGLIILLATPCFAELTRLTPGEMKSIVGQSGIETLFDEEWTEEQRREEEEKNRQAQDIMALSALVPTGLLRDLQYVRETMHDTNRIVRQFNTMQEGFLAVPTTVTTIISLPPFGLVGGGGFFF